jgi:alpha,alpha-trehalase
LQASHTIQSADFDALIFDLDGVVTRTAVAHAASWKRLFDGYLKERSQREGEPFVPFEIRTDYRRYVDGKPRYDGVRSFLESRGIRLARGAEDDPPGRETICGLGNQKNGLFLEHIRSQGVEVFESTVTLIRAARSRGMRTGLVTSSRNGREVVRAAGLGDLFDVHTDGVDLSELGLAGKPAPDLFLEAARRLEVAPRRAVVFEDAEAGVRAGKAGGFGLVVGVASGGGEDALRRNGADIVVSDLQEMMVS